MNQAPTPSAGASASAATVEFFQNFKKEIASYLAQKISFSLFHQDRYPLLRKRITELVDEKLAFSKTKLEPEARDRLINEIFDGIPKAAPTEPPPGEDSFSKLHSEVLSHLAPRLPDGLLKKVSKPEAAATVTRIIQEKLAQYPQLDKGTARKIIEKTLERLDPSLPAFLPGEESPKVIPGDLVEAADPQSNLQRDVIYFLATNMDPSVFENPDPAVLRKEIDRVLEKRPDHLERPVSDDMKESIIADIMAKGTIEFQL